MTKGKAGPQGLAPKSTKASAQRPKAEQQRHQAESEVRRVQDWDGAFLQTWLQESATDKSDFDDKSRSLTAEEQMRIATERGFRTWKDYLQCLGDCHRALERFVHGTAFRDLWDALRNTDPDGDSYPSGFSSANAGVPAIILRDIVYWHQAPKFTAAELTSHMVKVIAATDKLIDLLQPLTPSGILDPFDSLPVDANQARRLFRAFRADETQIPQHGIALAARMNLKAAGLDALGALGLIKDSAERGKSGFPLPRKVRAATAFRTYLIVRVEKALHLPFTLSTFSDQLVADVVSELANADCSADDVRKALAAKRAPAAAA